MNNQKLIMENWRRFLNENDQPELNEQEIDEGLAAKAFGALLAFASMGQVAQAGETVNGYDFGAKAPISVDASVQGVSLSDVADELKKRGDNETAAQLVTALRQVKRSADLGMGVDRKTATDPYSGGDNIADGDGMDSLPTIMGDRSDELIDVINHLASGGSPDSPEPGKSVSSGGAANVAALTGMLAVQQGGNPEAAKVKAQQLLDLDQSKIQTGTSSPEVEKVLQKIVKGERVTQSDIQTMKASLN